MKANKQFIIDNIISYIEIGTPTENICAAICTKFQFKERTFYNHYKIAQQQHSLKREAIKTELMKVDTQFAIESRKMEILSAEDRKLILSEIARGKLPNSSKVNYDSPLWAAIVIKAIAELNRMEGDYSPTKIDFEQVEIKVITGMVVT